MGPNFASISLGTQTTRSVTNSYHCSRPRNEEFGKTNSLWCAWSAITFISSAKNGTRQQVFEHVLTELTLRDTEGDLKLLTFALQATKPSDGKYHSYLCGPASWQQTRVSRKICFLRNTLPSRPLTILHVPHYPLVTPPLTSSSTLLLSTFGWHGNDTSKSD